MKRLRIRYRKMGGHYHCRVYSGLKGQTFAMLGELVLDEDDWGFRGALFNQAEFIEDGA